MKFLWAKNLGFCFGVRRAVDAVLSEVERGQPVATLGPIIHNPQVVAYLAEKGVQVLDSIQQAGLGVTILRSHGVGPAVYDYARAHDIRLEDATCPFVRRIQQKAEACRAAGVPLLIVGQADHPEVVGINGWNGGQACILQCLADAEALQPLPRACVVAQTTASERVWEQILPVLEDKVEELEVVHSICNATSARQQEAEELARQADCVLVIGGKNSSNTRKLFDLCRKICPNTFAVEDASELPLDRLSSSQVIAITSGASTPDWILKEVFNAMIDIDKNEVLNQDSEPEQVAPEQEAPVSAPDEAQAPAAEEPAAQPAPAQAETEQPAAEAEANFLEDFEATMVTIRPGQVVTGKVVTVNENEVCVNIGYKSDGFIPRSEFSNDDANPADSLQEGDEIEVEIVKVNDGEGNVLLSKKNVDNRKYWKEILDNYESGARFTCVGKQAVKGGLIASINGVRAFIPASHLDTKYVDDIDDYVGKTFEIKIIEVEKHRRRVGGSRKLALQEDAERARAEKWDRLVEGSTVKGTVRRLTDFGAFVDIGGVDGLIHVTNLAWGRVQHPSDVVSIGQQIECVILKVDKDNQRVSLGYKQLKPKPWDVAPQKYVVGTIVQGKVVRIVSFGAFVELEPGLDGLVHISQIADRRIDKVESVLEPGQVVNVKILDVNPDEHRISLSIREANVPKSDNDYVPEEYDDETYDDEDLYEPMEVEDLGVDDDIEE